MIPGPHRLKGAAIQLGARPGLPGPFGTWTDDHGQEHEEPGIATQELLVTWFAAR